MVREEEHEAAFPTGSDKSTSRASSLRGMTRATASSTPDDAPALAPASSIPISAPAARRLARTQTVIEHLQQNLSSRLKESTVQSLRWSYGGGRALSAPEASQSSASDTAPKGPSESPASINDRVDGETQDVTSDSASVKNHIGNGSVSVEQNEEVVLRKNPNLNSADSSPESDSLKESSKQKSTFDTRDPKPRVSWTTKLLERLSLEESQKKERAEQQRAARSQRRLVRYPGQKDFIPTHVSPIVKRVSSLSPLASTDRKPLPEKAPLIRSRSADRSTRAQPPPPPPRRSTLTDASETDGGKDGYAELISELTTGKNDEKTRPKSLSTDLYKTKLQSDKVPRRKNSASDLFRIESVEKLNDQIDSVPRPKSVASELFSPNSVFDSNSPRSVPTPTSPPAVSKIAGDISRKRVEGDYFVFSKEFVEANTDPLYARSRRSKPETNESSSKISENTEPRAMNSPEEKRSSYGSSRPLDLSKKPLSLVNNLSFDEDSMISRGGSQQTPVRQGTVELPGYSSDTGRLKGHSPLVRGGSPASTKSSPGDVRSSAFKGNQRSPASDTPSGGRPRSASPRTTRKSPGSGRSTPSGLRRLLSPGSLFSSSRHRQASGPSEEAERRSLLAPAKVHPVQNKPIVETAFLSNASPTKQNQANQSRRSKSVSPSRERGHHHPQQQLHHQQQHIHQPQPTRPQQLQAPPPSPTSPITSTQQQYYQHHHIPILQPAPIRLSPRQVSPMHVSPPQARASPLQSSPSQSSPRTPVGLQESSYGSLQGSPVSQGSSGQRSSSTLQDSPISQSSQTSPPRGLRIEERFQQLRRELSPPSSAAESRGSRLSTASDALLSLPPPAPRRETSTSAAGFSPRSCDSPDSVGATFVRSRRDVRYASLPARYAPRPSSAPLHLQQPIYENVQARYVTPIALDLERNAISGSPDIRQQLQQQKRQLLLQQRRQQEQLYLLQQQTHLGGRSSSPLTSTSEASSTYGMPSRSSASTPTTPATPTPLQQQRALYEQHQRVQYEQMRRAQLQQQMAQQLPARCSSAEPVQLRHKPIFKRGSLVAETAPLASPDGGGSATPKRVSFTGGVQRGSSGEPRGWPTRNGPAPTPPTRQHAEAPTAPSRYNPLEHEAPNRPLPPVPLQHLPHLYYHSESESGSEAGEVQRILMRHHQDEEWGADGKARGPPGSDHAAPGGGRDDELRRSGGGGARSGRRDEPRRHTLSGDHHHQHQAGSLARSMDLESPLPRGYPPPSTAMLFDDDPGIMSEVETSSTGFRRGGKQRSSLPVVRTPSKTLERPLGLVFLQYRSETKRALLPNEITSIDTVKALFVRSFPKQLTMEYLDSPHVKIYIHDSSKDMFYELEDVRSHLRDIRDRSVLRLFESADINGGVLPGAGVGVMAPSMWDQDQSYFSEPEFDSEYQHQHIHKSKTSSKGGQQPYYMTHSYPPGGASAGSAPATLPRGGPLLRAYSPAVVPPVPADRMKTLPQTDRLHSESGYMSSPERGGPRAYPTPYTSGGPGYEDPYYSQYASRSGSITPVIDEEASDTELMDEQYSLYGVKLRPVAPQPPRGQFPAPQTAGPYDATRLRVENMERQLANLTGLVQKALTQTPTPREYLQVPAASRDANYRNAVDEYDKHSSSSSASLPDETYLRTDTKPPKLGKDKSVSFEKSVSFSDEPPDMNSPKQHSPQHTADSKPTKPAIKSSTLPRMSSQERTERDRHKPAPPPKPVSLSPGQYEGRHVYRDLHLTPEMYNQLRGLQKKAKDLRQEVRNLRRMSQAQAHTVRETIRDTFIKIRTMLLLGGDEAWSTGGDAEKLRLSREEDAYKQEMLRLEKDLTELESTVEELRGNVINRKTRVNMSDVENMALILSKSSKTVADLKVRFPSLQEGMKGLLSSEMEKVVREEKFLKEEPERLESALRRCKKLTGTLVTLKRLASVQEQRLPISTPESRLSPTLGTDSDPPITPPAHGKTGTLPARGVLASSVSSGSDASLSRQRPENALDALLDELQTFARPPSNLSHNPSMSEIGRKGSIDSAHPLSGSPSMIPGTTSSLRRLHSYPSSSDGGGNSPPTVPLSRLQVSGPTDPPKSPATSPKPPVPERNSELLSQLAGRRVPPPPPPRTSSRSPLASPTSPLLPPKGQHPNQPQMGVGGGTLLRRGGSGRSSLREPLRGGIALPAEAKPTSEDTLAPGTFNPLSASNSSSCESVNSQEGLQNKSGNKARQEILEQRHQELLRKQRALQEQYARLQQLQRGGGASLTVVPPPDLLLKKTGSESNLLAKMGLGHGLSAAAPISGSLRNLAAVVATNPPIMSVTGLGSQLKAETNNPAVSVVSSVTETTIAATNTISTATTTTNKIYETDIL